MNEHATKFKGDLALTRVMYELSERGWYVFNPVSEHLPFDLMIYRVKDDKPITLRIQVKYRECDFSVDRHKYKSGDFDFFAIYCRAADTVIYVGLEHSIDEAMSVIGHPGSMPSVLQPIYWYEDFLKLSFKRPTKRVIKNAATEFAQTRRDLRRKAMSEPSTHALRMIQQVRDGEFKWMPAKLQQLAWKHTITHLADKAGISDVALRKRMRRLNLLLPPNPNKFWLHQAFRENAVAHYAEALAAKVAEFKALE